MAENTKDKQEVSGTGATDSSMVDALSAKRESLIYASYEDPYNKKESSDGSNNSVVDIISNYTWNNETAATTSELSYSSKMNIPSCFVIEREQTVSSSIMNIVRDANIIVQGGKKVIDALSKLGDMVGNGDKGKEENKPTEQKQEGKEGQAAGTTPNAQGAQTPATTTTPASTGQQSQGAKQEEAKNENNSGDAAEKMINQVSGFASKYVANANKSLLKDSKIDGSAYNNGILAPYNFLYATKLTGFKYAFPLLSGQEFYSLTTAWQTNTDNSNSILLNNPITQMLHKGAEAIANTVGADAPNILNVLKRR